MRGTSYVVHLSECPGFTPADSTNCRLKVKAHGGGTRGACPSPYPNLTAATQQHDQNIQNFRSAVMKEGNQGACMADTQHCTFLFKELEHPRCAHLHGDPRALFWGACLSCCGVYRRDGEGMLSADLRLL